MKLGKYSFGTGDRFGKQGKAQLKAIQEAEKLGIQVTLVWNKSNREHQTIKTHPESLRAEADEAIKSNGYTKPYFVDADHITLSTVNEFMPHSDFFTLDVADFIGKKASNKSISDYVEKMKKYAGKMTIPGIQEVFDAPASKIKEIAQKYLFAIQQAGLLYRHIESKKGKGNFITEVSMDEVENPQTPLEMFFILAAIAEEKIPASTIAPKFTGRFNKGVDYVGDINQFRTEFEQDLLVINYAIEEFGLPVDLKLSIHSGSDKFAIYPIMGELIRKHDKGIHVKTAGTTWLEEVIGLSIAGDDGLAIAKSVYRQAYQRAGDLCAPYATVIDIDEKQLPEPGEVDTWDGQKFANTLRHIPGHADYNPSFRQLIHVGYKVAAEMGDKYLQALDKHSEIVGKEVTENILDRHIKRLFL